MTATQSRSKSYGQRLQYGMNRYKPAGAATGAELIIRNYEPVALKAGAVEQFAQALESRAAHRTDE
ncbi:MAG: hypothetical protein H8F28_19870 [Fibrella sp.]|nr:hypothetical protein [Armatimonadota bacterium]